MEFYKVINTLYKQTDKPHLNFRTIVDFLLTNILTLKNNEKRDLKISDISIFPINDNENILVIKINDKFFGCLRHKNINNCLHTALAIYLFSRLHIPDNYGVTEMLDDKTPSPSPLLSATIKENNNTNTTTTANNNTNNVDPISRSITPLNSHDNSNTLNNVIINPSISNRSSLSSNSNKNKKIQTFIESRLLKGNNKLQSISYTQQHKSAIKALEAAGISTENINITKLMSQSRCNKIMVNETTSEIGSESEKEEDNNEKLNEKESVKEEKEEIENKNANKNENANSNSNSISPCLSNIDTLPKDILFKISGFNNESDYKIQRNIEPPIELINQIFPFINNDSDFDIFTIRIKNVLHMLRKSLIQDMVILKKNYPKNPICLHPIFNSNLFNSYALHLENLKVLDNQLSPMPSPLLSPLINHPSTIGSNNSLSSSSVNLQTIIDIQVRHDNQINILNNQINGFINQQVEIYKDLQKLITLQNEILTKSGNNKSFQQNQNQHNQQQQQQSEESSNNKEELRSIPSVKKEAGLKDSIDIMGKLNSSQQNFFSIINNPVYNEKELPPVNYSNFPHHHHPFPINQGHLLQTPPPHGMMVPVPMVLPQHQQLPQHLQQQIHSQSPINNNQQLNHQPPLGGLPPSQTQPHHHPHIINNQGHPPNFTTTPVHMQGPVPIQGPPIGNSIPINHHRPHPHPHPPPPPGSILPPGYQFENEHMIRRRKALGRRLSRQATTIYEMWDDFKSLELELEENEVSITEWLKIHGSSERQFRHTRLKIIRFIEDESRRTGKSIDQIKDKLHKKMRNRAKPWTLDEVQRMLTSGKRIDLE